MIKLAIFDMDGTIVESYLNWPDIKKEMGIKSGNILKEIYIEGSLHLEKLKILEEYEEENSLKTKPINGVRSFLSFLTTKHIKTVLITNNNRKNTEYILHKFNLAFDRVFTREMNFWKPEPFGLIHAMELYNCQANETISIGDSNFDVWASREAEIKNVFIIENPDKIVESDENVHFFLDYFELKQIISHRFGI